MRRLTSCGSRGAETNPPVHRRSVPFWIQYASRSVFPRSLSSAVHDCRVGTVRPDLLVRSGARWALVHRRAVWCRGHHRRRGGGALEPASPSCCAAQRTSRAFLMSDHAPGCGRFAPRPDPRNGLQQLLSPLLRSFLARQTSCLQPSCAAGLTAAGRPSRGFGSPSRPRWSRA